MKRFFEILPGALAWGTIIGMFVFSWLFPVQVAVFIILFDVFWLFKTIHFASYLTFGYKTMRETMKVDWLSKARELPIREDIGFGFDDLYHLVIFPMYKESYSVVKEAMGSLVNMKYPLDKFIVVLTGEGRAGNETKETIERIEKEFEGKFFRFYSTIHPDGLLGEIPGKGSNEARAAEQVKKDVIHPLHIPYEKILVSTFDVDTQVYPQYFGRLAHGFFTAEHPYNSSYQPIAFFINNIYEAPVFARIIAFSTTFWNIMNQVRPEQLITFSSHSMPFKALVEIGFWTKDHVSEDSLIFWQCFLHYNGDWRTIPLNYPVSMDANVAPTFWKTMRNIYKQQRRWAWGCENIPFIFEGFRLNKKIPLRQKIYWIYQHIDIYWGWATNALLILALGRLPLILGGEKFNVSVLSHNLPQLTSGLLNFTVIGAVTIAVLSIMILPPKPLWFKKRHYLLYIVQWFLLPVNIIFFSAIPGLESQTRMMLGGKFRLGFWVTPKARKGELVDYENKEK